VRIVEVISGAGLGGAERALARRLQFAPRGVETHVVITGVEDSHLSVEMAQYADVHRPHTAPLKFVRSLDPDLIVTHNPKEAIRILSHRTLPARVPVAVVAHNEISSEGGFKRKLLDPLMPILNGRAWRHLAVSSRAANGVQCRGAKDIRVTLLGSTVSLGAEPRYDFWPQDTRVRLAAVGRFSPQKNLHNLLLAVHHSQGELIAAGVHLVVAGDGPERSSLLALADRLGIEQVLTIREWIEPSDGVMAAADALLIASCAEGGPLTLYEALLAGARVVSTDVGASLDVLPSDERCDFFRGSDVISLSHGLVSLARGGRVDETERANRRKKFEFLSTHDRTKFFYDALDAI